MIEKVGIKRASAIWKVNGHEIIMQHRVNKSEELVISEIERYIKCLKNKEYTSDNFGLCRAFEFLGGISFVNIGYTVCKEEFITMFAYFTKLFVSEWIDGDKHIHSKNIGIEHVFEVMLRNEKFDIKYNYTYIFDEINDSSVFVETVNTEFYKRWTEIIKDTMQRGESLVYATKRIGLMKVYICCRSVLSETEKYLKDIAVRYTNDREVISERKLYTEVFGVEVYENIHPELFCLIRNIVTAEYERQVKSFVKDNSLQCSLQNDVWKLYQLNGKRLKLYQFDFRRVEKPFLKQEIKAYMKYRVNNRFTLKDRSITQIIKAFTIMAEFNDKIAFAADIDECDVKQLYDVLESEHDLRCGREKSPLNTMNVFSECKAFISYLMSDMRKKALKTPIPKENLFEKYVFVNSKEYSKNTEIIPEEVLEQMELRLATLPRMYSLMMKIFIATGLRAKEVAMLECDCIEPSKYDGTVQLKFKPYKVLKAYQKSGLGDYRTLPISKELGKEITEQIRNTDKLRKETKMPYIFQYKKGNKVFIVSTSYLSVLVNKMIDKYDICNNNGQKWHFTTRQCRKTIAVTLIENGASADELAYWLGHLSKDNTMRYYAEVRKMKLAEMNSQFFKEKFDLLISKEQLTEYSEEERKLLYTDFCVGQRRVELGFCLQKIADGGCNNRNSMYNCVNCKNLCTGRKYLKYWQELLDSQTEIVDELLAEYQREGLTDFADYKEYKQEIFLKSCYENIVNAIEEAET